MEEKVVLYSFYRSSASWRARIALAIKGIKYEYVPVDLLQEEGMQCSDEYRKLNPMGQVPTLFIDSHYLNQSLPIIEYLDETRPEPPLLPRDAYGRAKVRAIAEIINSGIQPLQNNRILKMIESDTEEWTRNHINYGFKALEKILAQTAGKFSYGDELTLADIVLVPQVFGAKRFKVDMTQFPTISRLNDMLVELPAFKQADAFRQPDTPEQLRVS